MSRSAVTVVMPYHRNASTVGRSLQSIRAQTVLPEATIIVHDVGTAPPPADALGGDLGRIRLIENPEIGPGAARRAGVKAATTEFVAFLDADDEWLPEKLSTQLVTPPKILSCTGYANEVGSKRVPVTPPASIDLGALFSKTPIGTSTVLARREALQAACDGFSTRKTCEDLDTWHRVIRHWGSVEGLPQILTVRHVRLNSISANKVRGVQEFGRYLAKTDLSVGRKVIFFLGYVVNASRKYL